MSLRLRLTLILGSAFILLWSLAAAWMLCDLRGQMMRSFDQRLAASARMVAGLLQQLPQPQPADGQTTRLSAEQLGIPNGMACQVSSLRGEVLAQSHATPERALDSTASGFRDQEINGVLWRSFTVQAGDLRVSTADRLEERDVLQRSVVVAAAVPVTVALLGSLALLWLGAGQGLAPLKRIRDALTRRGADSLEPLELAALPSELKPLVETQNQLFQRIAQAIERERRLTGDAAHELRSPLTAIKTHLQVARMTEGAAAEQALAHAEEGADRLHRTLDQLLLLARVEGSLSFDDGVQCSAEDAARVAMHDAGHGDVRMFELKLADGLSEAPLEVPRCWPSPRCATCWTTPCATPPPAPGWSWRWKPRKAARASTSATTVRASPKPTCRTSPGASGATARAAAAGSAWPSSRPSCNAANAGWTSTAARTACG